MKYKKITPVDAKKIIDSNKDIFIIDVRTEEELEEGYIENSILIPNEEICEKVPSVIPDKNSQILVYCRSGKRSMQAAKKLTYMGYSNVMDFGGIINWPFEIIL